MLSTPRSTASFVHSRCTPCLRQRTPVHAQRVIPCRAIDSSVGVVICDHGSRRKDSNDMLFEFGELYKQMSGSEIVEMAHMEIAEPTIAQAIGKCVSRGAQRVIVAPYFLSRGRHIQEDIPALVAEARLLYPHISLTVAEPIGIDPLMAQLISNRVEHALQKAL